MLLYLNWYVKECYVNIKTAIILELDSIPIIMLAVKSGKKNDCKIPLKNVSDFSVHYEIEFLH